MNDRPSSEDAGSPGESYTRDPKDIVTETAFRVDRTLLGVPLASPWRRLGAMLMDLVAVGGLVLFKEISAGLFVMALAWIMWRVARTDVDVHVRQAWLRGLLRISAVVTFVAGAGVFIDQVTSGGSPDADDDDEATQVAEGMERAAFSALEDRMRGSGMGLAADVTLPVMELGRAGDPAEARQLSRETALALYRAGANPEEVEAAVERLLGQAADGAAWEDSVPELVEGAMARVDSAREALRTEADRLMDDLVAAARAGDTARVEELREEVFDASVRSRVRPLQDRIDRLEDRLEEARSAPPGITDFLREILDDLGIGFSWLAFYFTAFLKLWRGLTPGKRLLGLRVVKVRGGEIGWWDAFGRFGGYAASLFTGLVGFAQVFWDPNRQGLHDRIAGTVVIRE